MVQTQIKDNEELYKLLKQSATYFSDRTRVVELPDKLRSLIPAEYPVEFTEEQELVLDFDGKNFILNNVNDNLRLYLEMFNVYSGAVSSRDTEKIYTILPIISEFAGSYSSHYYPLNPFSKISDLECSKHKYRVNKKSIDLSQFGDVKLKDLFDGVQVKTTPAMTREAKIYSVLEDVDTRGRPRVNLMLQYKDCGKVFDLNVILYEKLARQLLTAGKIVNILVKDGKFYKFLPDGITLAEEKTYSPSKEAKKLIKGVPVAMFRTMYYEYLIRS